MKKIININLSGRVIPIEDSAYEKLQAYIETLRRYFANEEGKDEIINDIESRIAELMSGKIAKGASSVTDADIDEIIASMGTPADFDAEAADMKDTSTQGKQQQQNQQQTYSEKKSRGRLYRDTSDKYVGGVCSGIAAYLNVDPTIVRILFAIITFGGFGLGFLAYILLWIILPQKDLEGFSGKRLYRNPDDRVLGGVAGGLAAYFDKRTSTIRLIFAAPIVLSVLLSLIDGFRWHDHFNVFPNLVFGSLSGTFILAYVILWMILPEANTTYEKMEMRGEKVDVNSIRQNVKEGMGNVKDRVNTWTNEVKESAQNFGNRAKEFANTRSKTFASEVNQTARRSSRGIGHAIGVLFKVFFLFIAGTIAFALFVTVIALIFGGVAWWPVNNFLWTSKSQQLYAWGTLIFFLGVPLIGFIIWLFRRILRVRRRNSYLGWTFGFLWTIGWVVAILLTTSLMRDFSEYENTGNITVPITQPANGTMVVVVSQPELEYRGRFNWMNDGGDGWDLSPDTLRLSTIKFTYPIKSFDGLYHVTLRKYSFGRSTADAKSRAEKIQYTATSMDSILDLANGYAIDKDSKFRGQQVEIEIQIPVGKKIRFDNTVNDKLNITNLHVHRKFHRRKFVDVEINDDDGFRFRSDVDYTMSADGSLKDNSGNSIDNYSNYRYDNPDTTGNKDVPKQETLEERKKRWEEEGKKLKEEEQKKPKPSAFIKLSNKLDEESIAMNFSPMYSLMRL